MSIARDANVDVRIGICEKSRVDLKILISALFLQLDNYSI